MDDREGSVVKIKKAISVEMEKLAFSYVSAPFSYKDNQMGKTILYQVTKVVSLQFTQTPFIRVPKFIGKMNMLWMSCKVYPKPEEKVMSQSNSRRVACENIIRQVFLAQSTSVSKFSRIEEFEKMLA